MLEDLQVRGLEYAAHLSALCGVPCRLLDMAGRVFVSEIELCTSCTYARCNYMHTHLYGGSEAYRWNGKYIYYCPLGLVFAASSLSDDTGLLTGALIVGPLVMGDREDTQAVLPEKSMAEAVEKLPVMTTQQVNHLTAVLAACTAYVTGLPHSGAGGFVYEQEKILQSIYTVQGKQLENSEGFYYPIEYEKELHTLIGNRDKNGAQRLLNELLGHIYCSSQFDLEIIKTRMVELIVLLSRATIDAGADIQEIFLFNTNYIHKIEAFTSIEELSVWLTGIMHRFINYSFDFTQVKHSDVVYKVMEYVKANFAKKLTLDDIARHVYLSRSYLSSIFKEETGRSLFAYINDVRVEKSKMFLMDSTIRLVDISNLCGFEDQSYFTKVFKKSTGLSPKQYRDSRTHTKIVPKP